MSVLVIAEHDQNNIKVQTQVAVAAAKAIGGDIHIFVAGQNCQGAADAAAKVDGVQKVLLPIMKIMGMPWRNSCRI